MGKSSPPHQLAYAWQCQRWGAMPNAGGLRDQPVRLMKDMAVMSNVYDAMKGFQRAMHTNIVTWQTANPDAWQIVSFYMKWEKEHRGRT